jgi:hypothetical protein
LTLLTNLLTLLLAQQTQVFLSISSLINLPL